jgi:ankyrin repeat protein
MLVEHDRTCVQKLDKDGRTPVYVACYHGNYEILKLLVENGGNLANMIILLHT